MVLETTRTGQVRLVQQMPQSMVETSEDANKKPSILARPRATCVVQPQRHVPPTPPPPPQEIPTPPAPIEPPRLAIQTESWFSNPSALFMRANTCTIYNVTI